MRVLWLCMFAIACGSPSDPDAGHDAGMGSMDAGADAGMDPPEDAGPPDEDAGTPGEDAGKIEVDAGSDAGIDCSTIGCAAPPMCDVGCTAPCGCCDCAEGEEITDADGRDYVCSGGCYARRGDLGTGDVCTMTSECGMGLSCCYPCGIEGCDFRCTPTCEEGDPGPACVGGCPLRL